MPIRAKTNLYPGVNPHLNSYLQNQTGWKNFHNAYVNALLRYATAHLPDGYFAVSEQSLQVGTIDDPEITIPDMSVYREGTDDERTFGTPSPTPTLTFSTLATVPEQEYVASVLIYSGSELPGQPIMRFELLSPANKPPGSHHNSYALKRSKTLFAGLRLIEIDFLHQQRPVIDAVPSYKHGHEGAAPYTILYSDPFPTIQDGKVYVYSVGVVDALPTLRLPLLNDDVFSVDFGEAYNDAFAASGLHFIVADYEQEPENFAAYTPDDQAKILAHMAKIAADKGGV